MSCYPCGGEHHRPRKEGGAEKASGRLVIFPSSVTLARRFRCNEQVGSEGHPGVQPFRSKCGPWTAAPAFPESLSELQDHGLRPTPARSELRGIGTLTSEEHPSAGLGVHEKELIINALRRKLTRAGWKVLGPGRRTRPVIRTHP